MPGGQYTNLREQARSLGIDDTRWHEVAKAYAQVNEMFGDIVKVTPSSKVVGDMALMMVTSGLTAEDVLDPGVEVAFPESVVSLFRGDIGQPQGGFPPELQNKVLKGAKPLTARPGESLPSVDLAKAREELQEKMPRAITDHEFASWLMYPKVFTDYMADRLHFGDTSSIPTRAFFYGLEPGEEITVELPLVGRVQGKVQWVRNGNCGSTRTVFFELNGQPRSVKVPDRSQVAKRPPRRKVEADHPDQVGAPMPGTIASVNVTVGQAVERGDVIVTIEAMKMETAVRADRDGKVVEVVARPGAHVDAKDLLVVLEGGDGGEGRTVGR
jgi:pyruvate carboxylase